MADRAGIIRRAVHIARPRRGYATQDGVNALVATGGSAGTIIDTDGLRAAGATTALYVNTHRYRPNVNNAEDMTRIVAAKGFIGLSRTISHQGPGYTENPTDGTDDGVYLLLRDDPLDWNAALNEALRTKLAWLHYQTFTPTSDTQRLYTVGTAPLDSFAGLTRPAQIHNIEHHNKDEAANEFQWKDWANGYRQWHAYQEGASGNIYIEFPVGPPNTNHRLRVVTTRPFATVAADNTTIEVDEEWAAHALLWQMAEWLGNEEDEEDDWTRIGKKAQIKANQLRRQELGRYAFQTVGRHKGHVGGPVELGRAGR